MLQNKSQIGKAWAQFHLARYFDSKYLDYTDLSIQKNDNEAFRLYLLSAKQGYLQAQGILGLMYSKGRGCEKSLKQALYWNTLAANQGSTAAKFGLVKSILSGLIPGRSREDGIILLESVASLGHSSAQFRLAGLLKDSDVPNALFWYKKAALQNNHASQYNLSILLFKTYQNIPTAMYWLRKAAGPGHIDAIKLLQEKEIEIEMKCGSCFKSLDGIGKKCTRCKSVYYCNKECQVKDWKENHKKDCVDEIKE